MESNMAKLAKLEAYRLKAKDLIHTLLYTESALERRVAQAELEQLSREVRVLQNLAGDTREEATQIILDGR